MLLQRIEVPQLTDAEWRAVRVALVDAEKAGPLDLAARGSLMDRIVGVYGLLTGHRPRRGLANPRLEGLRRFVLATRRRQALAEEFMPELLGLGFSRGQLEAAAMLWA